MNALSIAVLVAGAFLGFLFLIAYLSGWRALASRFPPKDGRPATGNSWISISLGSGDFFGFGSTFLRGIYVGWSDRGLYLASALGLSVIFPPIEIPWGVIESTNEAWGSHDIVTVQGRRLGIPIKVMQHVRHRLDQSR